MASAIFGRKSPKGICEEMLNESQKEARLILQPYFLNLFYYIFFHAFFSQLQTAMIFFHIIADFTAGNMYILNA